MPKKPTYEELEARVRYLEQRVPGGLQESSRRFRKLIDDVSEISIQGYDEERRVIFWNSASEKIYGWTQGEALGRKLEELIIPPPMGEEVKRLHHRWVLFGEKIPAGELMLLDKEGREVPVLSSHVMYEGPLGKEMFCIDVDLTSIRQAEKEKEKLQAQLEQARKMEAVGTLAGGIAHDFNNILQGISGYVEILSRDKSRDDPDHAGFTSILKAAERATRLVRQLLLFSRKSATRKKILNLNPVVGQAVELLKRTVPKMIDIRMDLAEDLWTVHGDPVQMEQVVLNLGSNAADAMPGGGRLNVETANIILERDDTLDSMGSGEHVLIRISDTGHGMDQVTVPKIFDPFFTTKEVGKGTGLGLASAYGIIKGHGGNISCRSEPGRGAVFEIHLPALKCRAEEPTGGQKKVALAGGNETILVVDDEEILREVTLLTLKRFGYEVVTASNGEEALNIYADNRHGIDIVILDVNMPGMGGEKCLQELMKLDPMVKVLMASGYLADASMERCIKAGACGYIAKPYRLEDLLQHVRTVLD